MKFLIMSLSQASYYSIPLLSMCSSQHPVLKYPQSKFSLILPNIISVAVHYNKYVCSFINFTLSCGSKYIDMGNVHLYYYKSILMIVV
jgi:hypothetical protein